MQGKENLMRQFRVGLVSAVVVAALAWVSVAVAQPPAGKPGRGRGGPMMGAEFLRIPAVQKELKLTDDQVNKLQQLVEQMRSKPMAKVQAMSPEERKAKMEELMKLPPEERKAKLAQVMKGRGEGIQNKLREILTPEQLKRLHEIGLQIRGPMALADPQVLEQLDLADEQKQKIVEIRDQAMAKIRELMTTPGDWQSMTEEGRQKAGELRQKAAEETMSLLTAKQREVFEKMKGPKFEMPPRGERPGGKPFPKRQPKPV
jgi:Spy/CpxP family protein refolding chaperone